MGGQRDVHRNNSEQPLAPSGTLILSENRGGSDRRRTDYCEKRIDGAESGGQRPFGGAVRLLAKAVVAMLKAVAMCSANLKIVYEISGLYSPGGTSQPSVGARSALLLSAMAACFLKTLLGPIAG